MGPQGLPILADLLYVKASREWTGLSFHVPAGEVPAMERLLRSFSPALARLNRLQTEEERLPYRDQGFDIPRLEIVWSFSKPTGFALAQLLDVTYLRPATRTADMAPEALVVENCGWIATEYDISLPHTFSLPLMQGGEC